MVELGRNFVREDLGSGQFRLTQSLKPINYLKNGVYQRITNNLVASGDQNFPTGVDELCQFRLDTRIAGKSPLFYFGKGQSRMTLALLNANNVAGAVDGSSILFSNAWNNADLKLTMAGHRLQKDIFLRAGHPQMFQFRINSHAGFDPETLIFGGDFRILQPVLHSPNGAEDVSLRWDMTQSGGKYILACVLPEGDWAGWVLDPTLSLQPDATDGLDSLLYSNNPTGNYESLSSAYIGATSHPRLYREVVKFNLSSLPDSAVISSATLSLYLISEASDNDCVHRVYRQKRAWVESQVTWNIYSTGNDWQTAGGFGADDCEQTEIGNRSFSSTEAIGEFKDYVLTSVTKAGLDLGNGWLIKSDGEVSDLYEFASSDHVTAANRPKLVVVYTLPPGGGILLYNIGIGLQP